MHVLWGQEEETLVLNRTGHLFDILSKDLQHRFQSQERIIALGRVEVCSCTGVPSCAAVGRASPFSMWAELRGLRNC